MDIIFIGFMGMVFLVGGIATIFYVSSKNQEEERPGSQQESQILKALKNLGNKIPGMTPDDHELSQTSGTWYTAASLPLVWEAVCLQFKNHPIAQHKYAWQKINAVEAYKKIYFDASWKDIVRGIDSPIPNGPRYPDHERETAIQLELTFEPLETDGTAIHFSYRSHTNDISVFLGDNSWDSHARHLIRGSNLWLRTICLNLTQDPGRGSIF